VSRIKKKKHSTASKKGMEEEKEDVADGHVSGNRRCEVGLSLQLQDLLESSLGIFDTLSENELWIPTAEAATQDQLIQQPTTSYEQHPLQAPSEPEPRKTPSIDFTQTPSVPLTLPAIYATDPPLSHTTSHPASLTASQPTTSPPRSSLQPGVEAKAAARTNRRYSIRPGQIESASSRSHITQYLPKYGNFIEIKFVEYKMVGEHPNAWIEYTFSVLLLPLLTDQVA
jgi:hypothetical protein